MAEYLPMTILSSSLMFVAKIKILKAKSSLNILPVLDIVLSEKQRPHPPTDSKKLKKSPFLGDGNVID